MKELTIEEKAQRYDEALKKAKDFYKGYKQRDNQLYADDLESIFSELKENEESQDERIRKAIRYAIEQSTHSDGTLINGVSSEEALAWIEKQGESKLPEDLGEYIVELSKQFPEVSFAKLSRIAVRVKNWLEKQGEQKSAWSEEDERMLNHIIKLLDGLTNLHNWLKSIKYRVRPQSQWKPSEQDILLLERIANGKSNPQDFQASLCALIGQLKKLKE